MALELVWGQKQFLRTVDITGLLSKYSVVATAVTDLRVTLKRNLNMTDDQAAGRGYVVSWSSLVGDTDYIAFNTSNNYVSSNVPDSAFANLVKNKTYYMDIAFKSAASTYWRSPDTWATGVREVVFLSRGVDQT